MHRAEGESEMGLKKTEDFRECTSSMPLIHYYKQVTFLNFSYEASLSLQESEPSTEDGSGGICSV
jgi:hypothetical protein